MLHKMLHYIKCNVRSDVTFYAADPGRGFFASLLLSISRWRLSIFFGHLVSYAREQMGYSPGQIGYSPDRVR